MSLSLSFFSMCSWLSLPVEWSRSKGQVKANFNKRIWAWNSFTIFYSSLARLTPCGNLRGRQPIKDDGKLYSPSLSRVLWFPTQQEQSRDKMNPIKWRRENKQEFSVSHAQESGIFSSQGISWISSPVSCIDFPLLFFLSAHTVLPSIEEHDNTKDEHTSSVNKTDSS